MRRPLLWTLGFLVLGILIGSAEVFMTLSPMLLFGLSLLLGLIFCGILYRLYHYRAVFVFVLFILIGLWRVDYSIHSHVIDPIYVEFHGVVIDTSRTSGGNQRVVVRGQDIRVMAYLRPYQPQAALGQRIAVTGYLRPLARAQNPGGYDQFQHLRSQKIDAYIWPDEIDLGEMRPSMIVYLRRFRDRLSNVYDSLLPAREAGVIKSMVLGDRLDMDRDLATQYRSMGIFHILSISGMHVTILTMVFFSVLKLFVAERYAGIVVLVVMIGYCLMTGAAVPTVRAVTMGAILVFGRVLYRDYDLLASVSFAAIVLLIFEPLYLFNMSFQLSFAAVFSIGILKTPIERMLTLLRLPSGGFRGSLSVGIAAVVASYVVFAHHLYEIPIYSVIGNIVIMPTTTILLVLGALTGLVGLVWLPAAAVLVGPVYFILRFYELASSFFAVLPGAMTVVGGGSLMVTAAGVGVLLAFAYGFSGFGEEFRNRMVLLVGMVLVLVVCVFVRDFPLDLRVTVLHTHGGYIVLRHRHDILVVGTARGGESVLLRYLDMRNAGRTDGLVLLEAPRTADIRRLEVVLPRVQTLYLPAGAMPPEALYELITRYGVELIWLNDNDYFDIGWLMLQAQAQPGSRLGLQLGFDDLLVDITSDGYGLDGFADLILGAGVAVLGDRVYYTEYYGAVQVRLSGERIRYWVD